MDNNSGRRKGVVISYIYTVCNILVQLIYVPVLLSAIGQVEYGLYQLIGSVVSYIVSINGILAAGVGRFYCMYKAQGDRRNMENTLAIAKRMYWLMSAVTALAMIAIVFVFQTVYRTAFTPDQLNECSAMLLVLGVNCVVTMNNAINIAVITANERFVFLKGSQSVTLVAQPIAVILLTKLFPSALAVTCVVLAMNAACALVQRLYVANVLRERYTYHGWDRSLAKGLVGFSAVIVLVAIADQIFWKTDQLIVGYLYGAAPVAVYAVGAQVYMAYMSIGAAVSSVFLPRVSELYHHIRDIDAISDLFAKVGRISLMVCLAILGGFAIFGRDFIALWAGSSFSDAYYIALVIMIPFTVDLIQNLGLTILQVMDKYLFRGAMYLVIALLNIPLTIVLLLNVGLVGAALSTAVAMFVGNVVVMNWYYKAKAGLDIVGFWKSMVGIFVPEFLLFAVFAAAYWILPVPHGSWGSVAVGGIFYASAYVLVLRFCAMNDYEKSLFEGVLRKLGLARRGDKA